MADGNRSISIYLRDGDAIYLIPYGLTTQGFSYHTEPFEVLPLQSDAAAIWVAAKKALQNTNRVVPHPQDWNQITPWYERAGVRKWRAFASKAKAVSVDDLGEVFVLRALHWDGRGFEGQRDLKFAIPKDAPEKEVVALLESTIQLARAA
jgi:hypothetical protein